MSEKIIDFFYHLYSLSFAHHTVWVLIIRHAHQRHYLNVLPEQLTIRECHRAGTYAPSLFYFYGGQFRATNGG